VLVNKTESIEVAVL